MEPTHTSTCLDDDLVIPLVPAAPGTVCSVCEDTGAAWQPIADGGAGPICAGCMADLNWTQPTPV
jgi:hypothetical protein